jgi:tRNA(Ser,Leu) C12 N-acetylase TAN1
LATILKVSGEKVEVVPNGKNGTVTLEQLQKAVGGWVEELNITFKERVMFVDEEGRLKNKELNSEASILARRPIVGDAVICSCVGDEYK